MRETLRMGYRGTGLYIVFRKDKEFVQRLVDTLVAEKREVWLDDRNIEPTAEWLKEIFSNIEGSDNFLFVISPDSVISTTPEKKSITPHSTTSGYRSQSHNWRWRDRRN